MITGDSTYCTGELLDRGEEVGDDGRDILPVIPSFCTGKSKNANEETEESEEQSGGELHCRSCRSGTMLISDYWEEIVKVKYRGWCLH